MSAKTDEATSIPIQEVSVKLADLPRRESVALVTAMAVPGILSVISPVFIDVLMRKNAIGGLGFSASFAGALGTVELVAIALAAFILSGFRIRSREAVTLGAFFAVSANLACLMTVNPAVLLLLRAITGIGLGCAAASGAALLSRLSDPDRAAAYTICVSNGMGTLALLVLPDLINSQGSGALFIVLATIAGAALIGGPFMPVFKSVDVHLVAAADHSRKQNEFDTSTRPNKKSMLGAAGLLLLIIGDATLFSFAVPYGERVGLDADVFSRLLAGYTVLGIIAAAVAGFIAVRFGRLMPIILCCLAKSIASFAIIWEMGQPSFIVSQGIISITIFATIPWFQGAVAELDRSGRSSAIAAGYLNLGAACGPFLGGLIFSYSPFWVLPLFAAVVTFGALLLGVIATRLPASSD